MNNTQTNINADKYQAFYSHDRDSWCVYERSSGNSYSLYSTCDSPEEARNAADELNALNAVKGE